MEKIAQYCKNIKNKRSFQYFVTFIILISSLTIGVKTYSIDENIYGLLLVTDYVITIIFLIEIIIRFTNYKNLIGQFGHQDITNWIGKIPQIRYHTHLDFVDEDEDSSSESELSD